jgi:hypothetical protein
MKYILVLFYLLLLISIYACSNETKTIKDSHSEAQTTESELLRQGIIDVEKIDANNDGRIYECPMDWNVLSDQNGECPICGMNLREFTIIEVKSNLNKYGYKYKE